MLTARGEVTDRVVGLEMGADDYLAKPFEPRELVARMQSVLRRGLKDAPGRVFRAEALEVDFDRRRVRLDGAEVSLTSMEFALLSLLARNRGVVLSRDLIFERLKGLDDDSFDRSIDVLVSRLRQKLGDDPRKPRYITTVRGTGYAFTA
jgi:two-component system phosphate regulon response regulator OmpR